MSKLIAPATLVVLGVLSIPSFASSPSRSAHALSTKLDGRRLVADVKEGFHFNLKAPNQVVGLGEKPLVPSQSSDRHLEVALPGAPKAETLAVLYVCDDAKTYCDIHRVELAALGKHGPAKATAAPKASAQKEAYLDANGFWHGNFETLRQTAKKQKKILLVDFGARWCPGCVRFESETFPSPEFRSATNDFFKVHVDVDLHSNFEVSKQYSITTIPALLAIDADGEEITRLADYQPWPKVKAFLDDVRAQPLSLAKLQKSLANASDTEKARQLGLRLYASGRHADAIPFLEKVKPELPELRDARIEAAAKDPAAQSAAIRAALATETDTLRSLYWRMSLLEHLPKDSKEREELLAASEKLVTKVLGDEAALQKAIAVGSVGEFSGLERFLAALTWAEMLEAAELGDTDSAKARRAKAWEQAAAIGKASPLQERPGPGLRYLIVLTAAGKFTEADTWVQGLIAQSPEQKDLLRRRLRILVELGKFKDAVKVGEEALKYADGRMRFTTAEYLARAYTGAKKKEQAKGLLGRQLANPELAHPKLEDQRKKLQSMYETL